jgi:hypothetical protein
MYQMFLALLGLGEFFYIDFRHRLIAGLIL